MYSTVKQLKINNRRFQIMEKEVAINISIKPTWSIIREIQDKTTKFMEENGKSRDVIEATIMGATELLENAIKYGAETPDGDNIKFDLQADDKRVTVNVTNGIKSDEDIANVKDHIDKINASNDPAKLYTDRLMELMENPKPGVSQLGLYRMAYEGEFKLSYKYENKLLAVTAFIDI